MTRITIVIEDIEGGGAQIRCEPAIGATLAKADEDLTQAEGYAIVAWNALFDAAKVAAAEAGQAADQDDGADVPVH